MTDWLRRAGWLATMGAFALVLHLSAGSSPQGTPEERLKALITRRDAANQEFEEKLQNRELTKEQRKEIIAKRPGPEFVPELEALAAEGKGTDVAAQARVELLGIHCSFAKKAEAAKTLELLIDESIGSKALEPLPPLLQHGYLRFGGQERVTNTLATLVDKSPHQGVKASALYSLGEILLNSQDEASQKEGRAHFERLIKEFPKAEGPQGSYKEAAEGILFAKDNLQVGKTCPDFEATDENGVKFKLSDYRGKVVVLDFWGMW